MANFEDQIICEIKKVTKLTDVKLEIPPSLDLGDFAFPCFTLSKDLRKSPNDIASMLVKKITIKDIKAEATGPYINFFIDKSKLATDIIGKILTQKDAYGTQKQGGKIIIESPGPNTNKPIHLGHLRNMAIGISLERIYTKLGNKAHIVDIVNDRGVHICKSMLAYKKYGHNKEPDKKSDHFVGDYYILYSKHENKRTENEIKDMLQRWEQGDKETTSLWKKMNKWALEGFKETYSRFGIRPHKSYLESKHYKEGKDLVIQGLSKGIFQKDEKGAVIADLERFDLGKKVLLREDGTSVYVTQDMNLAVKRHQEYKMDQMIYVVASEQIYHFKVLFKVLELLGYQFVKNYYHLPYGMVYLPEGKMKSREGNIVDADNLMDEAVNLAKEEIKKRHPELKKRELDKRAEIIGLGAIKFFILKFDPLKDFTYDPKQSMSFEGETGPYVQYAHARICSILRKVKTKPNKADYSLLDLELEQSLLTLLGKFPDVIENSASKYKPHLIARYLLDLSQSFNEYYHSCQILKEETHLRDARLRLILAIKITIKSGLNLLGIESLEQM